MSFFNSFFGRAVVGLDNNNGVISTPLPYNSNNTPAVGAVAARANSIKLSSGVSTVNNFYVGYDIILNRTLANGKTYKQQRSISAYSGSTKVAIIDGVWDVGYEPAIGDSYTIILSSRDARVSINPVMQTVDYITSDRYGRNLDPTKDLLLSSWMATARKCDATSDVTVKATINSSVTEGERYSWIWNGRIVFEGTIRATNVSTKYIDFTSVIGKITNKWNSWKVYTPGDIVYSSANRFYRIESTTSLPTEPTHTTGLVNGARFISSLVLTKTTSGFGAASFGLDLTTNPVVKLNDAGEEVSGYSLYDADSIDYWRRLGWDEHSQEWATLHQTNFTIDTSTPMFDNINMMLEHFNGIFSYSQGKYTLDLEQTESEWTEITEDDIIGKISFEDSGNKSSYNSVTVSYSDPGNNFEARNISLFSQSYLKQDRNVPKKGNITVTGITNYYNVRLLADSYLKRSRFNATISMTLFPEFIELIPGNVVGITYARYNWNNKPFRIDTLTINPDGTISIVANEYHDSFYALTNMSKTADVGNRSAITYTPMDAPTNLKATNQASGNELTDGIMLTWTNAPNLRASTQIEIYSSDSASSVLTVTSISGNFVTFSGAHGLKTGSVIIASSTGNGFIAGESYFVSTTPTFTTASFATVLGGPTTLTLSNGTGLNITFNPFTLSGMVTYPTNTFLHTFANITDDTIKYYKIRYKTEK